MSSPLPAPPYAGICAHEALGQVSRSFCLSEGPAGVSLLPRHPCPEFTSGSSSLIPSIAPGRRAYLTGRGAGRGSACRRPRTCWPAVRGRNSALQDGISWAPDPEPLSRPLPRPCVWPPSGESTGFVASWTESWWEPVNPPGRGEGGRQGPARCTQ